MKQPASFGHWRTVVVVLACISIIAASLGYLYYTGMLGNVGAKVKKNIVGVLRF